MSGPIGVKMGIHDRKGPAEINIRADHVIVHQGYRDETQDDICLLVFNKEIIFSSKVQPICLPSPKVIYFTGI